MWMLVCQTDLVKLQCRRTGNVGGGTELIVVRRAMVLVLWTMATGIDPGQTKSIYTSVIAVLTG